MKKLIGKSKDGSWTTSPAAAYPPALCQYLASLIATAARCKGVDRSAESSVSDASSGSVSHKCTDTPINGFQSTVELDKSASGNVTEKFQRSFCS